MTPAPAEALSPRLWRLELPSFTLPPHQSTNSYLIADGGVGFLVDPGFSDPASLMEVTSLLDAAEVKLLKGVLLTHSHSDHLAGLPLLLESYSDLAIYLHPAEFPRLEPGVHGAQVKALQEGRSLTVGQTVIQALHTPGHSPGHLSFHLQDDRAVLAGDLVAGEGSTWVGLPEGDVAAYLNSLDRLLALEPAILGPGHGPIPTNPAARLLGAKHHRMDRERQLLATLAGRSRTLPELRRSIYPDSPERLVKAVDGTLLAHLKKLMSELKVVHLGNDESGPYALRG